jgi:potassium/hydrogen antiporter
MEAGLPIDLGILLGAGLLTVGVLVVGVSDRLRLPASLASLGIGMLVGSDGLGWIALDDMTLVRDISVVALIIILFEGGLTTKPSALRETGLPGFSLATVGVLVTAAVTALGVFLLFDVTWQSAMLMAAVVASTDAAVVFELLRHAPLPRRLAGILEVESGANDPVAILLTIGIIETIVASTTAADWLTFAFVQLGGGLALGLAVGWVGTRLLRLRLSSQGLYPLLATGLAGSAYAIAASLGASGYLAVYVCGLMVGALVPRHRRVIRNFHASLANGSGIALFLILGLLIFPAEMLDLSIPALAMTAVLVFLARPLAVLVSLLPFRLPWREQALLSWAGLRGAVPIVLATFPATAGVPAGEMIFELIFFVVLISTLLQGTTVVPVAERLGLTADHPAWQSIAEALPLEGVSVDLVEIPVTADLPLVGERLADVPPGPGIQVTIVVRGHQVHIASGDTVFQEGDLIVLAIDSDNVDVTDTTAWARGELQPRNRVAEAAVDEVH